MKGIIGKKIGMTSIFDPEGKQTPCTIIEAGPCVVTQVRTKDSDGYNALQLAFGDKNEKHSNKSETNHFAKSNTSPKKFVKEFRDFSEEKNIGDTITVDGQHDRSRAPGSLGNSSDASRVMKGIRMAGRMGNDRVKLKNLQVVKIFPDKNYILISGSVPGYNGSIVLIQK